MKKLQINHTNAKLQQKSFIPRGSKKTVVAHKEMSFRSTLSTFCFQIIIALLVQQRIFVCASECFCQCNQQLVCDELNRLATSDAANVGQWTRWNTYLMYLKTLHRDFDPEVKHITCCKEFIKNKFLSFFLPLHHDNVSNTD